MIFDNSNWSIHFTKYVLFLYKKAKKWIWAVHFKATQYESTTSKVSLLGVDSLWGGCMFIPADWDSQYVQDLSYFALFKEFSQ